MTMGGFAGLVGLIQVDNAGEILTLCVTATSGNKPFKVTKPTVKLPAPLSSRALETADGASSGYESRCMSINNRGVSSASASRYPPIPYRQSPVASPDHHPADHPAQHPEAIHG